MTFALALQIGQAVVYVILATVFVVMIKSDVRVLGVSMNAMADNVKIQMNGISENLKVLNNSFEKLGDILTKVAVQDERIKGVETDIRELKHGKGFVNINREYP